MEIDKDGVKWYTRKELMELLKTAERVPMRNFQSIQHKRDEVYVG